MNVRHVVALVVSCFLFGVAMSVATQVRSSEIAGAPSVRASELAKATNLQALPKDISAVDLDKLMNRYNQDLGVLCSYCHSESPETQLPDYAADENPAKQTARIMIRMLNDINTKYLAQVGDRRYADPLTCGNCHRGESKPSPFDAKSR
jgi:hypothetical protein